MPVTLKNPRLVRESEKAVLLDWGGRETWFPRTQILEAGADRVVVSDWIASAKGLSAEGFSGEPPTSPDPLLARVRALTAQLEGARAQVEAARIAQSAADRRANTIEARLAEALAENARLRGEAVARPRRLTGSAAEIAAKVEAPKPPSAETPEKGRFGLLEVD